MLKASLKDVPLIDGYLHDSYFKPDDITFDADQLCFGMVLERVCYEQAKPGKVLFFIPVVRYRWIKTHLIMTGVKNMSQKMKDRGVDGPDGKQLLLDIEQKSNDTIELRSSHLRIVLTIAQSLELTLEDEPEPLNTGHIIDFCKGGIFRSLDEIDRLRVTDTDPERNVE